MWWVAWGGGMVRCGEMREGWVSGKGVVEVEGDGWCGGLRNARRQKCVSSSVSLSSLWSV